MPLLVITTIIWSFSFSLIGVYLTGKVDVWFIILARISLAFLVFLPFLRFRQLGLKPILCFILLGCFQLGLMSIFYYHAFYYLSVPEILLFTIMTPVYVTLLYDLLKNQPIRLQYLWSALLAVLGAAIIRYNHISADFWLGLLLVQGANLCFAIGQVGYKRVIEIFPVPQHQAFAWFYVGACCVALVTWGLWGNCDLLPSTTLQWGILIWLGVVASGLGYFMWNFGATQVDAGVLAIMNNILIPAGILVNLVIWHQAMSAQEWTQFMVGSLVIVFSLLWHKRIVAKF